LDWQSFGINGRFGLGLFDDWFRISAGLELGAVHVQAPDCEDRATCGVRFASLDRLMPMDNWAFRGGVEVGLGFFHGALSLYGRLGDFFGVNPSYGSDLPGRPRVGLSIPNVEIGGAVEFGNFVRMMLGALPG